MSRQKINVVLFSVIALLLILLVCIYLFTSNEASPKQFTGSSLEVNASDAPLVNKDTVFEFVYNYADGISETYYSVPASYMTGWGRERIADAYPKWTIDSCGSDRIVMHKNLDKDSSQHYILKDNDGYITVYYTNSGEVKEVTSANIASLSEKERQKYIDGVEIVGEGELEKYLQDLES